MGRREKEMGVGGIGKKEKSFAAKQKPGIVR